MLRDEVTCNLNTARLPRTPTDPAYTAEDKETRRDSLDKARRKTHKKMNEKKITGKTARDNSRELHSGSSEFGVRFPCPKTLL